MEPLYVIEYIGPGFIQRSILAVVDPFTLEHPEEPLTGRVITTVAHRAHAAHNTIAAKETLVIPASELTAAVGM